MTDRDRSATKFPWMGSGHIATPVVNAVVAVRDLKGALLSATLDASLIFLAAILLWRAVPFIARAPLPGPNRYPARSSASDVNE